MVDDGGVNRASEYGRVSQLGDTCSIILPSFFRLLLSGEIMMNSPKKTGTTPVPATKRKREREDQWRVSVCKTSSKRKQPVFCLIICYLPSREGGWRW